WLPAHALPGGPCDVGPSIPPYRPERIEMDDAGRIYLLDRETDRIYRWSLPWGAHLAPIPVGDASEVLAWSSQNQRLYVGRWVNYGYGEITQIDVAAPVPQVQPFAVVPGEVRGLQTAGRFVFSDDRVYGDWHRTFDADGTPISSNDYLAQYADSYT